MAFGCQGAEQELGEYVRPVEPGVIGNTAKVRARRLLRGIISLRD